MERTSKKIETKPQGNDGLQIAAQYFGKRNLGFPALLKALMAVYLYQN